jgi:hypothetical protein
MKKFIKVGNGSLHNNGEVINKRPPYSGPLDIEGRPLKLAAWVKQDKDGKKYFNIEVTEVFETEDEPNLNMDGKRESIDDADIPF